MFAVYNTPLWATNEVIQKILFRNPDAGGML